MIIHTHNALIDDILDRQRADLGADFPVYRNHCFRVFNYCLALHGETPDSVVEKVAIAAAFHDLGIWTDHTFDYLAPSRRLAIAYLDVTGLSTWADEIETMIEQHHKMTRYTAHPDGLVEPFRKADWIDVSGGCLTFGLPASFVAEVAAAFPRSGFYHWLIRLALRRLKTHPLSPLPMMRF